MSVAAAIRARDAAQLPGKRDEDWRWTDLRGLIREVPAPSAPAADIGAGPFDALADEVAVVAAPDERLGERACAFVRMRPGAAPLSLGDVTAHLSGVGLARQKWPEELRLVDDFPRTASGKIRKVDLRASLRSAAGDAGRRISVPGSSSGR